MKTEWSGERWGRMVERVGCPSSGGPRDCRAAGGRRIGINLVLHGESSSMKHCRHGRGSDILKFVVIFLGVVGGSTAEQLPVSIIFVFSTSYLAVDLLAFNLEVSRA